MEKQQLFGLVLVIAVVGAIAWFFLSTETVQDKIPDHVTGETRQMYEWAKTPEGAALLEQIPCYCGCKYEGHLHSRHCFWRDDGSFDKHGITCSVCLDIAKKSKELMEQGKDACFIRNEIDQFYLPNVNLKTSTPMPAGCTSIVNTQGLTENSGVALSGVRSAESGALALEADCGMEN